MVLCTASVTQDVPPWFGPDKGGGWITAEYVMLPGSTPQRKPWPKMGHTDSRGTEIQRLIGRVLRAAIDLSKIGPHTIALDCQVLQADGGTRTAAICAAYVALVDALKTLPAELPKPRNPADAARFPARYNADAYKPQSAIATPLAAVSVGVIDGEARLDLDYVDDSQAAVDMNVAYTARGEFVEIQGAGENGGSFDRNTMNRLLDLAVGGCEKLMTLQQQALAEP